MEYKIIADSCCDTTGEIREKLKLELVPLKIMLSSDIEYIDTLDLDITDMIDNMKLSSSVKTTCPSIEDYCSFMYKYDNLFVVTLASFLSGSYNAAVAARDLVLEEFPNKQIHVFDSLNACSGELNLVLYINELIKRGYSFKETVNLTQEYIVGLTTLFVLEDLGNMIKNGRMSKITERVASILNIYPVLGNHECNEIKMISKVRGLNNAHERMIELLSKWTENLPDKSISVTMSHCEVAARAEAIKENILFSCKAVNNVIMVPTGGLSAVYANRGGIIISFQILPQEVTDILLNEF